MSTDAAMSAAAAARCRRALRLAVGTSLCLAISFGLQWPIPMVAPVLAVFLFASVDRPMPAKAGLTLALLVIATTGSGLLLIPFLRHAPLSGVLMTALGMFLAFRYGLRGGNGLVSTFLVAGIALISVAGTAEMALAISVIGALARGLLLGVVALGVCHWLIPDRGKAAPAPKPPATAAIDADWMAWRATLVVMPAFLLALTDPAGYLPIVMKAVSLGRQSCTTARGAAAELLGSTLLGGLLAILFWFALGLFVHLWMFFLWTMLFALVVARRLFAVLPTRATPGFWLNSLVTMIILLGQSVEDSAAGKDVYHAFAIRMGLFIGVSLYAVFMLRWIDRRRNRATALARTTT
ncbi:DUF2955 domain-containing protein [Cupriavidus lacunae]|uniref:DUF2955 domain-containing protein n=1 Tax=Cupriavidus lacunae TaxID=2666307 RepID=A0A370NPV5_9BURK|nr:DUF2955 domain-containing protein [Cupriavidus lacunae]RDK07652.1 hypothetical protein DN412_24760 [Cupriavidus lacunae]